MAGETRHRLLVVDDEAAQLRALCDSRCDHGYDATGRTSAAEALALLRQRRFDVMLPDLAMPGMDEIAFLRAALATDPLVVLKAPKNTDARGPLPRKSHQALGRT